LDRSKQHYAKCWKPKQSLAVCVTETSTQRRYLSAEATVFDVAGIPQAPVPILAFPSNVRTLYRTRPRACIYGAGPASSLLECKECQGHGSASGSEILARVESSAYLRPLLSFNERQTSPFKRLRVLHWWTTCEIRPAGCRSDGISGTNNLVESPELNNCLGRSMVLALLSCAANALIERAYETEYLLLSSGENHVPGPSLGEHLNSTLKVFVGLSALLYNPNFRSIFSLQISKPPSSTGYRSLYHRTDVARTKPDPISAGVASLFREPKTSRPISPVSNPDTEGYICRYWTPERADTQPESWTYLRSSMGCNISCIASSCVPPPTYTAIQCFSSLYTWRF